MAAVATQAPPPVRSLAPNVPQGLADLVMSLLAKTPEGRDVWLLTIGPEPETMP